MSFTDQLQDQLKTIEAQMSEVQGLLADPDLAAMAQTELDSLQQQHDALKSSIDAVEGNFEKDSPLESMDQSNAIMEIRGGTGGDEAKLFAEDLMRMYLRFCEIKNFKLESIDDGVVKIKAKNAFGLFKHESGVHRVQRVPATESQGRVHTSTASVAVLPEVKPAQVEIREEDLEWKFTRAGGKGGQNVNKVNTAVLLTHTPSGIVVNCRQERSQQQNRMLALDLLRAQLWEIEEEKKFQEVDGERRAAVGRAMRAEKIRTYNYPQNRVTDHRINESWYELDRIMEGDLEKVFATVSQKLAVLPDQVDQD
jgi:peptide chain release factor 1